MPAVAVRHIIIIIVGLAVSDLPRFFSPKPARLAFAYFPGAFFKPKMDFLAPRLPEITLSRN